MCVCVRVPLFMLVCLCTTNFPSLAAIRSLRVTALSAPPVFWNTLFSEYQRLRQKLLAEGNNPEVDVAAIDRNLKERFSAKLGGRCNAVGTGGAATSPTILTWMKEVYGTSAEMVGENYGK